MESWSVIVDMAKARPWEQRRFVAADSQAEWSPHSRAHSIREARFMFVDSDWSTQLAITNRS
jgi:hypothetical protein